MLNEQFINEELFKKNLCKRVEISIIRDGKIQILKKGVLLNFSVKLPFYFFKIQNDKGKIKDYNFPYPFHIEEKESSVIFDYSLIHMVNNKYLVDKLTDMGKDCESPLFDTKMYINFYTNEFTRKFSSSTNP